ncbi:UNVERIFIED_CONTAM: uncharacterized protein YukJ [Paenibacillus sp. PvR008]
MPIKYGVLKAIPKEFKLGKDDQHLEVLMEVSQSKEKFRLAINIQSQAWPSEVLYLIGENFNSSQITHLQGMEEGFTGINKNNRVIALDYVRGGLFDPKQMTPLPNIKPGPDNDLYEKLTDYVQKAIDKEAVIYAYGERFGPEHKEDEYFHFKPGNGVHDIHMNQGNSGNPKWEKDNGVWQDGGLLIQFKDRWVALFLAFQSQSWCTNDDTGYTLKVCSHEEHEQKNAVHS